MKSALTTTALVIVGTLTVVGVVRSGVLERTCEEPISYRVGSIDSRFDIATSTARELLSEAERVWEEAAGRELFSYDPEADLPVNFIFDERQRATNKVNEFESQLSELQSSHDAIIAKHAKKAAAYEAALRAYTDKQAQYESALAAYNERVAYWNKRGGAPQDVHQELTAERKRLNDVQAALLAEQKELEGLRQEVNELASRGNSLANEYNQTASTFTDRFGESQEFNQATFTGNAINVYQFEEADDLRLALAHELGHALGLEHTKGSESIMYYLMEDQSLGDLELSAADRSALNKLCTDA